MKKIFIIIAAFLFVASIFTYAAVSPTPMPWSYIYNVNISATDIQSGGPASCDLLGPNYRTVRPWNGVNYSSQVCSDINWTVADTSVMSFNWTNINNASFPAGCSAGNAITNLSTSVTCTPFIPSNANVNMTNYNATFKCITWGVNNTMC